MDKQAGGNSKRRSGSNQSSSQSSGLSGGTDDQYKPPELDVESGLAETVPSTGAPPAVPSKSVPLLASYALRQNSKALASGGDTGDMLPVPLLSRHSEGDNPDAGADDDGDGVDDDEEEEIAVSTYNQAIMLMYRLDDIRVSHRLQALFLCAVTITMQAFLPAALLNQWRGEEGFDDQGWLPGLFPRNLPAKDEATFWLQVTMLLVGTYCLFSCFKDFVQELLPMWVCVATDIDIVQRIYLNNNIQERHRRVASYTTWSRLLFQLFICVAEIICITLVLLVSFALTLRSEDVKDAILSGAGTLFILEVDATLGVTGPNFNKQRANVRKCQQQLQESAGNEKGAPPHIWFRRRRRRESYVQHLWRSFKQPFESPKEVTRLLEKATVSGRYQAMVSAFAYAVSLLLTALMHLLLISCSVLWFVMFGYFASRLAIWDWIDKVPLPRA